MKFCLYVLFMACSVAAQATERIIELSTGREIPVETLLDEARKADFVLLGERHDNPEHHLLRGVFISRLQQGGTVVAEHLDRGHRFAAGTDLLAGLEAAGFNTKGWRWPMHERLFAYVAESGLPLVGGNATRDEARAVAKDGESAAPADLLPAIKAAHLSAARQAALDADLVRGHCGQLEGQRLDNMRLAQRVRDAAMAKTLLESDRPAILLAGNGHVRLDYGVPVILHQQAPEQRVISVGFIESDAERQQAREGGWYTHVWQTDPVTTRQDPCEAFKSQLVERQQRATK